MLRCLFSTLFLLLACSTSCVPSSCAGAPGASSSVKESVEIFKKDCVIKLEPKGGTTVATENNKIKKVDNVFFVTTDKMLVAVAEANYEDDSKGDKYNFVVAYVKTTEKWDEEIFKEAGGDNCGGWTTQFATKNTEDHKSFSTVKNVVYDAENKKIYLLVVNKVSPDSGGEQWKYNLFVGTVSESEEANPITWDLKKESGEIRFENKLKSTKGFIESFSTYGGGFVTNNKKIVFMLKTVKQGNSKNAVAFVELKGSDSNTLELDVLHVEDTAGNCYPYLFLWDERTVMITTNCTAINDVNQKVKESSDITEWGESKGPFLFLSDFFKDKTSFTTAVIDNRSVLLFAKQKNEGAECKEGQGKKCFTFWFSDGNRTYNVGENVFYDSKEVVSSSLVFAKGKLFFLHQKSDDKKFFMTRLDKQLQNITATLDTWKSADDVVLNLCKSVTLNSEVSCSAPLPTKGLVGFLSSTNEDTKGSEWKDRYLYVNADIKGATFENGLTCSGAGQGARWLVHKNDEKDQLYKFTKYGFTLFAMLTIDGNIKNNDNSLLGLVLKGEPKRFGLWCTKENKWAVSIGDNSEKKIPLPEVICKHNEIYFVALILKNKKLSVYVDGQELRGLDSGKMTIDPSQNIDYFYFGSDENLQQNTDVTLTNVLLYNWPFTTEEEIKTLKLKKKM